MKPFAIAATLAATLTLAACGNAPEAPAEVAPPAAQTETTPAPAPAADSAPSEAPSVSVDIPADTMVPGTELTVEEALENVQQQVNEMQLTDAEKQQAVIDARAQAEQAARGAGLSDDQVRQAGDAAEQAAKAMFGIQ